MIGNSPTTFDFDEYYSKYKWLDPEQKAVVFYLLSKNLLMHIWLGFTFEIYGFTIIVMRCMFWESFCNVIISCLKRGFMSILRHIFLAVFYLVIIQNVILACIIYSNRKGAVLICGSGIKRDCFILLVVVDPDDFAKGCKIL